MLESELIDNSKPKINLNWSQIFPHQNTNKDAVDNKNSSPTAMKSSTQNVIESLANLQINPLSNEFIDTRTREQILADRKERKQQIRHQKSIESYQQKLHKIRQPKSDKIQLITTQTKDRFDQSTSLILAPVIQQRSTQTKRITAANIEINLFDLISSATAKKKSLPNDRRCRNGNRKLMKLNAVTMIKRHKGKKREIPKKKWFSRMKKSILLSRQLRKQQSKNEIENKPVDDDKQIIETKEIPLVQPVSSAKEEVMHQIIFSRKFRSYCNNMPTDELCSLTEALLRDLFRFQDRAYHKNQIKARAARRYVVGFKETQRQLNVHKVKLLIIAPDLEKADDIDGIDDVIAQMIKQCTNNNDNPVPYVFSLKRRKISYILHKKVPVSCVGILSYEGSEKNTDLLLPLIKYERDRFSELLLAKK